MWGAVGAAGGVLACCALPLALLVATGLLGRRRPGEG